MPNMADVNKNNEHVDLSNVLVALTEAIAKSDQPCNTKDVTLTQYRSDGNAKHWLSMYAAFASLKNWTEDIKIKTFPFYLAADAQQWFHSLPGETTTAWPAVEKAFIDNFSLSKQEKFAKLQSLLRRVQQPHESVSEYLADLARECNKIGRSEEQQIEMGLQGIAANLKSQVMLQDFSTFAELKRYATLVESVQLAAKDNPVAAPSTATAHAVTPETSETSAALSSLVEQVAAIHQRMDYIQKDRSGGVKRPYTDNKSNTSGKKCLRCGHGWHETAKSCPAIGKTCHKCARENHFARVCMSKQKKTE
jgi:hypothetical protein